jgi:hydrogenase-4 component E
MGTMAFDVAHMLAGGMLVLSFVLLYQDRITATLNVFALQSVVLSLSVAWQAIIQDAPHLLVTAAVALVVKGIIIPTALHRIVRRLGIHRCRSARTSASWRAKTSRSRSRSSCSGS